ncbi:hypothetical protein AN958_11335 [Leucoagaricus sp. SymC.cos]|nr:hypothetical protein AN958_11335 [Leucoagaricus sp. SymC.cos]
MSKGRSGPSLGLSFSTNLVPTPAKYEIIHEWLSKAIQCDRNDIPIPRAPMSKSYLKIVGVNFYMPPEWHKDGSTQLMADNVLYVMNRNPLFEKVTLASMPRIMKASPHSDMAIIWFDIWDSQKGTNAKLLTDRSFNFDRNVAVIRACNMHPGISQCQNCWKWGHLTAKCRSQGWKCAKCGGPHKTNNHWVSSSCCKANEKAKPPHLATPANEPCPHLFKCINCKGDHAANDKNCPYWCNRFNKTWHANKTEEARIQQIERVQHAIKTRDRRGSAPAS